jgi:hypothetical protein
MITLLAAVVGFCGSIVPELLKVFKDYQDKNHELQIFEKQIKVAKHKIRDVDFLHLGNEHQKHLEDRSELNILYKNYTTGINFIDALNGSVRPVLAYAFFALYSLIKFMQYKAIAYNNATLVEYINVLWNLEDQAIFTSIVSFYFGQRTFRKMFK